MIPRLAHPNVCVIDDDPKDYIPILKALAGLGLAYKHIRGTSSAQLRRPLQGIRLVFTDLHLSGHVGKDAASHTANVFKALIPADTAPLVVIIWSKYADEPAGNTNLPPEDQPTEADLFQQTLLDAVPAYKDRLIFFEMKKPKPKNRPTEAKWAAKLKTDIKKQMEKVPAFDVLWAWESLVRDAGTKLTQRLTTLALTSPTGNPSPTESAVSLHDKLRLTLRLLAREQGGPDCTQKTAAGHLTSVLAQTLADQLEHTAGLNTLSKHGTWLGDRNDLPISSPAAPGVNGLLLTGGPSRKGFPFIPGTIYRLKQESQFQKLFGKVPSELLPLCYGSGPNKFEEWKTATKFKPVILEISPACDVHQGTRLNAMLLGGLILSSAAQKHVKRSEAVEVFPTFKLRWPANGFIEEDVIIVFFSRLKVTMPASREPAALIPWFRLRELPTASLRNWQAGHGSRVGYVSLRAP